MFKVPFPDNVYGVKGDTAFAVVTNWSINKGGREPAHRVPAPGSEEEKKENEKEKKPVYKVTAQVSIFFDEEAHTKKLQPLKTETKTIDFDANPSEEALERELEITFNSK